MRIDAVETLLRNHVTAGTLTLPATALEQAGGDRAARLVGAWFGDALTVEKAELGRSGSVVTVAGTPHLPGLGALGPVTIEVGLVDAGAGTPVDDGVPGLYLPLTLPAKWTFAAWFPATRGSALDTFAFPDGSRLFLTSEARPAGSDHPALAAGAWLAAKNVSARRPLADFLLLDGGALELAGTITPNGEAGDGSAHPVLDLASPPAKSSTMDISFAVAVVTEPLEGAVTPEDHHVRITAGLTPPGVSRAIVLTGELPGPDPRPWLELTADAPPTAEHRPLDGFAKWLGADGGLTGAVGGGFDLGDSPVVRGARIVLRPGTSLAKLVERVEITVGLAGDWSVLDGLCTLTDRTASFQVVNPFGGGTRQVVVTGGAEVDLASAVFQAVVTFSGSGSAKSASLDLETVGVVNIADVLKALKVDVGQDVPNVVLSGVGLTATVPSGAWRVTAQVGTGKWRLGLGGAAVELTSASIDLDHPGKSGKLTGRLDARAAITPADAGEPALAFGARWDIPGRFTLGGEVRQVSLTAVLDALAGKLGLPDGLPAITVKRVGVTLELESGQATNNPTGTEFTLTLRGTAGIGVTDVSFLAHVKRGGATGKPVTALAGALWLKDWTWFPEPLAVLADLVRFGNTGLALCTVDGTPIPDGLLPATDNLPASLKEPLAKGVTLFARVGFAGSLEEAIKPFFGARAGVELTAVLASPLAKSSLSIRLAEGGNGFRGVWLRVTADPVAADLRAAFTVPVKDLNGNHTTPVKCAVGGRFALSSPPTAELYFVLADSPEQQEQWQHQLQQGTAPPVGSGAWQDPLGISGVTIENFFGSLGLDGAGGVDIGGGGKLTFSGGGTTISLDLLLAGGLRDGVPFLDAFRFHLVASRVVTLGDVARLIAGQDVPKWLGDVLDEFGLDDFLLSIVLKPGGWYDKPTKRTLPQGYHSHGHLVVLDHQVWFDVEVVPKTGVKGSGNIDKAIVLGGPGVFALTDADQHEKGPSASLNTLVLTGGDSGDLLYLSGRLVLLAVEAKVKAKANTSGGWDFTFTVTPADLGQLAVRSSLGKSGYAGSWDVELKAIDLTTAADVLHNAVPVIPGGQVLRGVGFSAGAKLVIGAAVALDLKGSVTVAGEKLAVDIALGAAVTDWNRLSAAIVDWLAKNPGRFLEALVSDVGKWAELVGKGVISVGGKVADILKNAYHVAAEQAAELLKRAGVAAEQAAAYLKDVWNLSREAVADALHKVWNLTDDTIRKLLDGLFKACALTKATRSL
ncbi:hypothetical protein [Saccharothrix obliqua]|uniref:hypothetical protein n=1 Tax=Saccharothrix obliqua TaxID=2861747 RepID=UPI001C5EA550|nr:hypothetical protein [Saccharothrix obliqua]MBW4717236.1 hypothetical protein [Saccharothrix obliqua]